MEIKYHFTPRFDRVMSDLTFYYWRQIGAGQAEFHGDQIGEIMQPGFTAISNIIDSFTLPQIQLHMRMSVC